MEIILKETIDTLGREGEIVKDEGLHMRQDMPPEDPRGAEAQDPFHLNKLHFLDR